jgi:light-regulated signal transduction histidine kinase (bacteriophytochrome)
MFVATVVKSTKRMRNLLSDLLAYAQIGTSREESLETDLNLVIDKVRQNLKMPIDETCASVSSNRLPILSAAHECHFVQLFQNLIGNAIKYRGELTSQIRISATEVDGMVEFAVADNGLGVDPKYHERIFQPFQRLHDNQSPGTGMGLAICQRIVDRYGGRIWVESAPGRGSTFRFVRRNIQAQVAAPVLVETEFEERGTRRSVDGPLENKSGQFSFPRLVRRSSAK